MNPLPSRGLGLAWFPILLACAPSSPSTLIIESRTEQGLLTLTKVTAKARVALLNAAGNSATFTHEVLSPSTVSVATTGRVWVARGAIQVTFVDRDGRTQTVRAAPGSPGEWTADIRTRRLQDKEKRIAFSLNLLPLEGQPPKAEGVVVEVVYGPGVRHPEAPH
ncbi:MAG TPA: hypothetical protein VGK03_03470 [Geothrix sp.]|jgi:hypothetical protein